MSLTQTVTWVPVSERLPEEFTVGLLVATRSHILFAGYDEPQGHGFHDYSMAPIEGVTHWAGPIQHPAEHGEEAEA